MALGKFAGKDRAQQELIKSGDLLGSGDYNGFMQGCLATEIAIANLHKQPVPAEINLKALVMDRSNYQAYEIPVEQRTCPTLQSVSTQNR